MHFLGAPVRVMGCLLGMFLLFTGLLDVLGYVPYSNEMPPWPDRLTSSLPSMLGGAVLLLSMRRFTLGPRYAVLQAAYLVIVFAGLMKLAEDSLGYLQGHVHGAVIPTAAVLVSIVAANAGVLWHMHRRAANPSDPQEDDPSKATRAPD